jgi:hypothetical protein
MAKIRKPGRPKRYTAAGFEKACEAYFNSISYMEPMMKSVVRRDKDGYPILDKYGHSQVKTEQIVTADGSLCFETRWVEPPSLTALCLYLGIDRATFARYGTPDPDNPDSERFCNTVTRARGRVEAYLESRLEDKSAARGAIFNLQQNFGWKEKREVELGPQTQSAMAVGAGLQGLSMAEKIAMLKDAGMDVSKWE